MNTQLQLDFETVNTGVEKAVSELVGIYGGEVLNHCKATGTETPMSMYEVSFNEEVWMADIIDQISKQTVGWAGDSSYTKDTGIFLMWRNKGEDGEVYIRIERNPQSRNIRFEVKTTLQNVKDIKSFITS